MGSEPSAQAPAGQVDQAAAKQHLTEARESLSQLTSLPEAAKLQGDARTQVSQLISNFNELITTQTNWRAAYAKVDTNLTALLGADPSNAANNPQPTTAAGSNPVGTSGTTPAAGVAGLDPAIRAKLVDFRTHLNAFEKAAGGSTSTQPASDAMAPSVATGTTANPANPAATPPTATAANPDPSKPSSGAVGTSGTTPSTEPTATMNPADRAAAAGAVNNADAQKELDAISAILSKSKTGALTRAQTAQLKKHVEALRALLSR